ncbi:MAG TPA: hypothetical protein VFT22_26020 [Kofleriaceae bacterium]|nr:hypothetical protein [Kofleriaceae bacterium]
MNARYRLAPMREARARNERVRQGDLSGAVGDAQVHAAAVEAATRRVEEARAALAGANHARDRALTAAARGGVPVATLAHLERYIARLRHALDAALGERSRAQALHRGQLEIVDAARERLARARAERELVERHFAAWRAERRKLAERRED